MLNILDKLAFGLALLFALQIPLLADHYQQFQAGYYQATKTQVDNYKAIASNHEYENVRSMINDHLTNNTASVRADAQKKLDTLQEFETLEHAISLFENSNIVSKAIYMFNPKRADTLLQTLDNFKPGIPLTIDGLLFGVITGLLLNLIFNAPLYLIFRRRKSATRKIYS